MGKIDGGPAFPMPMTVMGDHVANEPVFGMTLRDYFAAKAMHALIATPLEDWPDYTEGAPISVSRKAYKQADAMLKAREAE